MARKVLGVDLNLQMVADLNEMTEELYSKIATGDPIVEVQNARYSQLKGIVYDNLGLRLDATEQEIALTSTCIKGTTQSVYFNDDNSVNKIQHKNSEDALIREDVFSYDVVNQITEVRTLNNGSSITFINHLDTLEVEVI